MNDDLDCTRITEDSIQLYKLISKRRIPRNDYSRFQTELGFFGGKVIKQERELRDKIVNSIMRKNPTMVSEELILVQLFFRVIGDGIWFEKTVNEVESELEEVILKLITYSAYRNVDFPLMYLGISNSPFKFGLATFYEMTNEDYRDNWKDRLKGLFGSRLENIVISYVRVHSPGAIGNSLDYAEKIAQETLLILRAIGGPFSTEACVQFGLINDHPFSRNRPFRLHDLAENFHLEYPSQNGELTVPFIFPDIADLLNMVNPSILGMIQKMIEEYYSPRSNSTDMQRKFMLGLRWIGEATKPDNVNSRFAKLAFALESLIGGDPSDVNLSTRGITATLAERGAFIASHDPNDRRKIHTDITRLYGKRSGIVHGHGGGISEQELEEFATLIRQIAWALLEKLGEFGNINELQNWVFEQRYL